MSSRLDRLFVLLESGTSSVTRRAAAKQLGEIQKLHPHELHRLLTRIKPYLHSASWDTRIAAGHAVQAIVENVPKWEPLCGEGVDSGPATPSLKCNRLDLCKFDLESVLKHGVYLTGSEGTEYDVVQEDVAKQRQLLNAKLGLDTTHRIGIDMEELITTEDLRTVATQTPQLPQHMRLSDMVDAGVSQAGGLSSRERNRARRKARQMVAKQNQAAAVAEHDPEPAEPRRKKSRHELGLALPVAPVVEVPDDVPDATGDWGSATEWPLEGFCDGLMVDLLSARWETRHGAATALREVMAKHGCGAGKTSRTTGPQMRADHELWLQDLSLRLLCVLCLDRFGDFVSDQVVAPVRETCAQTLGACLTHMSEGSVHAVMKVVSQLVRQKDWEARHGGLLALKYILALRKELVRSLLHDAVPLTLERLADPVDDVAAVAAASLVPVAHHIVSETPGFVADVVDKLWELLLDQDELAAACNSFMGLLAALLSIPEAHQYLRQQPLPDLLPRLWPYLGHNASSVRRSTLQTLRTLTQSRDLMVTLDTPDLLQPALRHVLQRVLVEHNHEIQELASDVWKNLIVNSDADKLLLSACPMLGVWLCLTMHSVRTPLDQNLLIVTESLRQSCRRNGRAGVDGTLNQGAEQRLFLGGGETTSLEVRELNSARARCIASKMLGLVSVYITRPLVDSTHTNGEEAPVDYYVKLLLCHLTTHSALQRLVCGLVITHWAELQPQPLAPSLLVQRLEECLCETVVYDEVTTSYTRLVQEAADYVALLQRSGVSVDDKWAVPPTCLEDIHELASWSAAGTTIKTVEERRLSLLHSSRQTTSEQASLVVSCQAALAGALVELRALPVKLNPVIKPLMDAVRREPCEPLQRAAARQLAHLVDMCVERTPCPNGKVIANLSSYICADRSYTPTIHGWEANASETEQTCGILTLVRQQRAAERALLRRQGSQGGRGPGRPAIHSPAPPTPTTHGPPSAPDIQEEEKWNKVQRRGATLALQSMAERFGASLAKRLPKMWGILRGFCSQSDTTSPEDLLACLMVLENTATALHPHILPELLDHLPDLCSALKHELTAVRHMAARCLAVLSSIAPPTVMNHVAKHVLPLLESGEPSAAREGAAEAIHCIVDKLQLDMVPYVVLLVLPLLGRMSDQNASVRAVCTQTFASLIQLMPLDSCGPLTVPESLLLQKEQDRSFLDQLLNPHNIPDYVIPVPVKAQLRPYQKAGVNWLGFLNKYKLHGILCDDMGLGKTLQSICILAGDHHYRHRRFKDRNPELSTLPSIVICPPTLTGHWVYEIEKFVSSEHLRPLHYCGPPCERERLRRKLPRVNVMVASYDIVRKDIDWLRNIHWNYCILDEGHIIKNGKTKASKAIKTLSANHRLILSGTPIQNNVLELWSLFDFLMPGFLSTEKEFSVKYSRPILASRDAKSSAREQEAGVIAMESLHRQVLPFLLRRMKEDVLKDLPPKITQDYICELSPLQQQLYEDFSRSQAHQSIQEAEDNPHTGHTSHVFQALRYLQNVCNHPKLVLTKKHPQYQRIMESLAHNKSSINDINHACKLTALKQLLLDCGIGAGLNETYVSQHRALIFCQLKAVLDMIEKDLLQAHLPQVSYLRLDGSVTPTQRHAVVSKFNADPSIDVLLLTTHVGGLGLNLTGADTVIFVEHDWNPMKDLQAMDRAHRIGQKKVVNVYRLITKGTLEEKIMGLQRFKLHTANTVISQENKALETMATHQLFDLFTLRGGDRLDEQEAGPSGTRKGRSSQIPGAGVPGKSVLENLPELWEQRQYEEEYDLSSFMATLSRSQ